MMELMYDEKGVTLVELIVAISIIAILAVALGFQFTGWMGNYRVESWTREIYADLMKARMLAAQTNRAHFAVGTATSYSIYEDYPLPDGDETFAAGTDRLLPRYPKTVPYTLNWPGGNRITFQKNGLIFPSGTLRLVPATTLTPDVDCLEIRTTKIDIGKWDAATSTCIST